MSNHDDLIRRGYAMAACGGDDLIDKYSWHCKQRIAALPAAQVAVKPLMWVEKAHANCRKGEFVTGHSLLSFAPVIAIHKTREGWWLNVDCKTYPSLDAAKAAAQTDYAARIRAALDVGPAPDVARLVEALRDIERNSSCRLSRSAARIALAAWEARNE